MSVLTLKEFTQACPKWEIAHYTVLKTKGWTQYLFVLRSRGGTSGLSFLAVLLLPMGSVFSEDKTDDHPTRGDHVEGLSSDLRNVNTPRE